MLVTAEELSRALHMLPCVDHVRADSVTLCIQDPVQLRAFVRGELPQHEMIEERRITFEKTVREDRVVWALRI